MRDVTAPLSSIRFANFLSPLMESTYASIARYVGTQLGYPTMANRGQTLEEFATGEADVGFLCGLFYVRAVDQGAMPLELLAAPVLSGERYQKKPIYFSDVVVRRDSPYTSFDELAGCVWAYNEQASHSGWNLVRYSLLERGKTTAYFGTMVSSGSHLASLRMVIEGKADATAIDSHVLDLFLRKHQDVAARIRVIDMLGPSTIPPVVVASAVEPALKEKLREVLLTMHLDAQARQALHEGSIERFVSVTDQDYQDVRAMFARVQGARDRAER